MSKGYRPIVLRLSYDKTKPLNHQIVPKVVPAFSYSKEGSLDRSTNSSLKMTEIEKSRYFQVKNLSIRLFKSVKIKALSAFNFQWKIQFLLYLSFFGYKRAHKQRSRGKDCNTYSDNHQLSANSWWKNFGRSLCQTRVIPALVSFFTLSDTIFEFEHIFKCQVQSAKKKK